MAQARTDEHKADQSLHAAYGLAIAIVIAAAISAVRVLMAQYWQ
jgi:hypothetical protein